MPDRDPAAPPKLARWRRGLALICALAGLGTIGWAFWRVDLRYSLATPRPPALEQPALGARPELPAKLQRLVDAAHRPALLHFFNPDCPCSRFNLDHLRELEQAFHGRVLLVAVLEGDDARDLERSFDALGLDVLRCADTRGAAAHACGVYSTPQAVVLDQAGVLRYRGNYNASRYCRDRTTEFARIALEHVVAGLPVPNFDARATTAYGCALPADAEARL